VLILLPPSEGKCAADAGPTVDLAGLSFPSLTSTRRGVLKNLVSLCRGEVSAAMANLGLGPTQRGEIGANARLRKEPCAPAIEVYTGVLYESLDAASLTGRAGQRLHDHVAIASALWGLVRPSDLIPSYRLSAATSLPGLGPLSAAWRAPLEKVWEGTDGLVVDLRSSAYVGLGPLPPSVTGRAATVRVLTERDGRRTVVSHNNKATKGRVVRALLQSRRTPRDATSLADALEAAHFRVEHVPGRSGRADVLDVIVDAV
jgi:cytoplasmic iron level regulating protein YaaA (DUF328/UPF0246 family)